MASPGDPSSGREFSVEPYAQDGVRIVEVRGEVDLVTAPTLAAALAEARVADEPAIVIDLGRVTFVDSSGLAVLISARRRLSEAGVVLAVVCTPGGSVMNLLAKTGLASAFHVYPSVAEALDTVLGEDRAAGVTEDVLRDLERLEDSAE